MTHVVLLGDSVFDNAAYVGAGPDVVQQLRALLAAPWHATLCAVDGATLAAVPSQLASLPDGASHLVISAGGNDALSELVVLDQAVRSVADAIEKIAQVRERFAQRYQEMLDGLPERGIATALCTIYEGRFPDPVLRRLAATGLTAINDAITREAFRRDLTLIDLRLICDSDEDFANPIEPSVAGGAKIARAIARFATREQTPRSEVIAR